MLISGIIETAIGVVLVYLLLSLIASGVNEAIAQFFRWRARDLEEGLIRLLAKQNIGAVRGQITAVSKDELNQAMPGARDLVHELYKHPLIQNLTIRQSLWE